MRSSDRPDDSADSQPLPATLDAAGPDDARPAETETAVTSAMGEGGPPALDGRGPATARGVFAPVGQMWHRLRRLGVPPEGGAPAAGGTSRSADAAASALARLTTLPAVLVVAWLVPGLPLLLGGSFLPVPMLLISVPLAAALTVNGLREVPSRWPQPGAAERPARSWTAWFGLLGTVAVVAGLVGWQLVESTESLIVLRDAGTYLQAGYWIAQHGVLPIPQQLSAFDGFHPGMSFASIGFLAHGASIFPAVTPGMPMLLAAGVWAHGVAGGTAVGPILGGLTALSFAGLVGRLVGPQWAPAGALILGLTLPEQYVSRSSLSETALQLVLFGGLSMLADSLVLRAGRFGIAPDGPARTAAADSEPDRTGTEPARWRRITATPWVSWLTPERMLAGLAGLALGLSLLLSLDGALYLLPLIPFGGLLVIGHRPQAAAFAIGSIIGTGYGLAGVFLLDRPFADTVDSTLAIAGVAAVWLLALAVIAGQLTRFESVRRQLPQLLARIPLRWLPVFGAVIALAVLIGFAVRPYVQTVRGHPSAAVYDFIAGLQRAQALPVDPTRLYSEQTLYWVIWYIGLPTVLLGGFGIVLLVYRCLRALVTWRDPDSYWRIWALPLAIICAGSLAVLWRPDIVPDQPWASRRLVVIVLPGFIVCALWAASWLSVRARSRGAQPVTAAVVGLFCCTALLVPTVATTFGIGLSHGGKTGGLHPVAQGMALQRTGAGQIDAVTTLCAEIPRRASVVIVDVVTAERFSQVIRGMCGVPVTSMAGAPAAAVDSVISSITAVGRRPVLLASVARRLAGYGGSAVRILDLQTTADPHELTQLPTAPAAVRYVVWMTEPSAASLGT